MLCFLVSFHLKLSYEHGTIGICRCNKLNYPIHRPFFCDPEFYPSPPKSWQLPTYANDIANQLAGGSYQTFTSKYHLGRVLEFLDIEAFDSDGQASSDTDINDSRISSSLGDHSDSDMMK
jgi:hypothetical protein